MSTEAEIKECLESVWSEVKKTEPTNWLENILVPSDDEPEVPEGQLPSANQVVAVIAGVSSLAPDDDSVATGGLVEAHCVGEGPPQCSSKLEEVPANYSPSEPECSASSGTESADRHHRRKSTSSDKPKAASSRIPRKQAHKLPKKTPRVSPEPKPVKPKPTAEQWRARAAE